jgi:hypothetical protein
LASTPTATSVAFASPKADIQLDLAELRFGFDFGFSGDCDECRLDIYSSTLGRTLAATSAVAATATSAA